jgi:hypothetical protein
MSALIVRLPDEKHSRLRLLAKARKVSLTRLIDEMATVMLAEFDAETRFHMRAARGARIRSQGMALLRKAAGRSTRP